MNVLTAAASDTPCGRMEFRLRWEWPILALGVAAVTAACVWYAIAKGVAAPLTNVDSRDSIVRPMPREIGSTITTSGTVRLRTGSVVRVGSQVSGIIRRLNVTVGSRVERGGVIAIVDSTTQLARLAQTKAQLDIDQVARDKAVRDRDRVRRIAESGLISQQQVEDLRWAVELAEARVVKSKADLRAAEVDLSYTTIRAPIAGTIASVATQQGETVAASFAAPTFVTIVEDGALELVAMVDETDIAGVAPGQAIRFSVEAYPGRDFNATVRRIDPTATIISGVINYAVIADISNGVNDLKPDMTANIVLTKASRQALFLPKVCVYQRGDRFFVDVVRGGMLERQAVVVGSQDGELLEVVAGVSSNDSVRKPTTPATTLAGRS